MRADAARAESLEPAEDPIRVYVGAAHSHRLMVEVLRWSIQRRTRSPVQVQAIGELAGALPMPRRPENRPATPFSFQRFAVPQLAGYQGRAIYMDSDQLVLRDIAELAERPMWGMRLLCRRHGGPDSKTARHISSVMLLDCARLDWSAAGIARDLDEGRYNYRELMSLQHIWLKGAFPRHWNALDYHEPPLTGLVHYTRRETQPWVSRGHPLAPLWFEALFSGLDAGVVRRDSVDYAVDGGYARPSLRWQVERRIASPLAVPAELHARDAEFFEHCRRNQFNNLDGDYRSHA